LHFAWSKKGDLFTLSGDIVRPLIYGLILAILLILRIPAVRKGIASLPARRLLLFPQKDRTPAQNGPQAGD
jgi:DMSO/TMAO reductase YedYZ heme-binding membrane subunit